MAQCTTLTGSKNNPTRFIEFLKYSSTDEWEPAPTTRPGEWEHILLLERDFYGHMDLMYAYDIDKDGESAGTLYLGHWNDGVAE